MARQATFTPELARFIKDQVEEYARSRRDHAPIIGRTDQTANAYCAITTSAVPARTGTTWGEGSAILYSGRPGSPLVSGRTVTVYNWFSQLVSNNKHVHLLDVSGYLNIIGVDCL